MLQIGEIKLLLLRRFLIAVSLMPVWLGSVKAQQASASYQKAVEGFREKRTQSLTVPDGWLSLVGLEWLQEGRNTVGSAADNTIRLPKGAPAHLAVISQKGSGSGAQLSIAPPSQGFPGVLKVSGKDAVPGSLADNAKLTFDRYTILILSRGDRLGLRIKDVNAPARTGFHGLTWYPVQENYRIQAKWIPYREPHTIHIPTIIGTTLEEKVAGAAEFQLKGKRLRLEPIVEGDKLFFILRDTTSRTSTYQAARFLYTALPSAGLSKSGEVVLDFNELVNPPCAYTAYATCPLPPPQNKLDVAIAAGEKRYHN